MDVVSKQDFAALVGVSPSCVSQWIARKKISGKALVGRGCRARIRVEAAREQLKKNLDIDQRLGANARAKLDQAREAAPVITLPPDTSASANEAQDEAIEPTIEERIKAARLEQIALSNAEAREEAAGRSGAMSWPRTRGRKPGASPGRWWCCSKRASANSPM